MKETIAQPILEGKMSPVALIGGQLAFLVFTIMLAIPWGIMAVGLILAGMMALGGSQGMGELWICLPAGLALGAALCAFAYYLNWAHPRRTISAFRFDGSSLEVETPAGNHKGLVSELSDIHEVYSRRGYHLVGWSLTFPGDTLFLPIDIGNCDELIARLREKPKDAPAPQPVIAAVVVAKDRGLSFGK